MTILGMSILAFYVWIFILIPLIHRDRIWELNLITMLWVTLAWVLIL